jgi:hypothetical protein
MGVVVLPSRDPPHKRGGIACKLEGDLVESLDRLRRGHPAGPRAVHRARYQERENHPPAGAVSITAAASCSGSTVSAFATQKASRAQPGGIPR